MDCSLPVTGANVSTLVMLALLLIGAGVSLVWIVRRRRLGTAAVIVLALAVGAMVLTTSEVRAGAQSSCPPSAPAAVPATTTTTTAPNTTTTTSTTVPPTTTTTTTTAVPDLTPRITGPTTLPAGVEGTYTYEIENVGTVPTVVGPMSFTITFTLQNGTSTLTTMPLTSSNWTFGSSSGTSLTFNSDSGLVIAPGAVSTGTFGVDPSLIGGTTSFEILTTLPNGIGGETNFLNNTATLDVAITAPT